MFQCHLLTSVAHPLLRVGITIYSLLGEKGRVSHPYTETGTTGVLHVSVARTSDRRQENRSFERKYFDFHKKQRLFP
jgi:hypothetical protein